MIESREFVDVVPQDAVRKAMEKIVSKGLGKMPLLPGEIVIGVLIADERGTMLPIDLPASDDSAPSRLESRLCIHRGSLLPGESDSDFASRAGPEIAQRLAGNMRAVRSAAMTALVVWVIGSPSAGVRPAVSQSIVREMAQRGFIKAAKPATTG